MPTPVSVQDPVQLEALARLHGSMQPTPRNPFLGSMADFVASSYDPKRILLQQGVMKFLGAEPIANTLNMMSYGEPLTTGGGGLGGTTRIKPEVLDAAMAAYGGGQLAKLGLKAAAPTVKAAINLTKDLPVGLGIKDVSKEAAAKATPDAFWMNAETKHIEPFAVKDRHSNVIQSKDYAAKLGITPEHATAYPIAEEATPLLMGRRTGKSMNINGLSDPTETHLKAAQEAVQNTPHEITKVNFGGGENLYENVPIEKFKNAETLADIAPFQLYRKGGSVKSKVKVEDPVMLERKLKLMGLI